MESIARTKPNMSVLRRDILPVSPFGILSQAFTEDILGRFESGQGIYPMYSLELLYPEEENTRETQLGGNVHLEVQLKLILQQLKESGKTPAAERILEKAETLRLLREKTTVRQMPGAAGNKTIPDASTARKRTAPWTSVADRALSSKEFTLRPEVAGLPGRAAHDQSGVRRIAALTGVERIDGGSYRPGTHTAPAVGMGYRQLGTHIGVAVGGGYKRPSTYVGAAVNGRNKPSGIYAAPLASAGNGRTGTRIAAVMPPEVKVLGTMLAGTNDMQMSLQEKAFWSQRVKTEPAVPTIRLNAALLRMGSPTVAGLPGQTGQSLAEVRFLTPQEAGASGKQMTDREKTAAGLTRQMEQAALQASETIAKAMTMEPQGVQAEDHHRYVRQALSDVEQKVQSSGRVHAVQMHPETKKDAADRDSAGVANHGSADTVVSDGAQPGGHSSTKEQMNSGPAAGRIGSTARDIRTSSGGQMSSLSDTELTASGAAGYGPALQQDKVPGVEGVAAASGYLPLPLEHTQPPAISEQTAIPGQTAPAEEAERRLAQAMEAAAIGAQRALAQTARDGRRESRPAAERKNKSRGGSAPVQAEAASAFASQSARTIHPAADHAAANRPTAGPLTAGRLLDHLPAIERSAENSSGVLRDLRKLPISGGTIGAADIGFETGSGLTAPVSTELAGQPPLTLEYLQELQKSDMQTAEQMHALSPKVLEKLLNTPGLRLLSKDIAVLATKSRGNQQTPHRRSQAAQRMTGRVAQTGGAASSGAAYRGSPGAAGDVALAKQPAVGCGDFSQGTHLHGLTQSRNMVIPSVRASGTATAGDMALLRTAAAAQSRTRSPAAQLPVELTHMEPSLETQTAGQAGQTVAQRVTGAQQEALLKEIRRSLAASRPAAAISSQSAAQRQTAAPQDAFGRGKAMSPALAGRRGGFSAKSMGQRAAAGWMGGFPRGRGMAFGATGGTAAHDGVDQETLSAYPALSMEYGGLLVAMARELRQTVEREVSQIGVARDMGLHTSAARAMEEKGAPETMQTLELMTQPQIQEQQVVWENPYMRSAPTEMAYHQKNNPQNQQGAQQSQTQIRMSDAEIRRAADKVFKLVQEKIVTERRRIGRM